MIRLVIVEDEVKYAKRIKKIIDEIKYNTYQDIKTYEFKGLSKI